MCNVPGVRTATMGLVDGVVVFVHVLFACVFSHRGGQGVLLERAREAERGGREPIADAEATSGDR